MILAWLLTLSVMARAEQLELTVEQAVARVVAASPELREAAHLRESSEERASSVRKALLPSLSAESALLWVGAGSAVVDGQLLSPGGSAQFLAGLKLEQPLYAGGLLRAREREALERAAGAGYAERARELRVRAETLESCYEWLRARGLHESALAALETARQHRVDVAARIDAGYNSPVDLVRAEVRVKEAEMDELERRTRLRTSGSRLGALLSLPPGIEIRLSSTLPAVEPISPHPAGPQRRPDVQEARSLAAAESRRVDEARSGYLPRLGLIAGWQYIDGSSWQGGLQASWNLFSWGSTRDETRAVQLASDAAEDRADALERDARIEIEEALAAVEQAAQAAALSQARLKLASEDLRLSRLRFREGHGTATEVLEAQSRLAEARAAEINVRADFAIGRARLWRVSGGEI
jgi:outer membrane protein TolC